MPMSAAPSLSAYPDLGDRVYSVIREQILSGKMAPGSLLLGVELAREIGVSRTPVSDALNVLVTEGLVTNTPRKGYFVASFSLRDYLYLMDTRLALEQAAIDRVLFGHEHCLQLERAQQEICHCQSSGDASQDVQDWIRLDLAFHGTLVATAANPVLVDCYQRLGARIHLAHTHFSLEAQFRPLADRVREHEAIVSAFKAGDVELLRQEVTLHVHSTAIYYCSHFAGVETEPVLEEAPLKPPARTGNRGLPWLNRNLQSRGFTP